MGDIADWLLDSEMDAFESNPFYKKVKTPTYCKYCGSKEVTWSCATGKWRLYTKGQLHQCPQYAAVNRR